MDEILYLEPDEEITSVVDKLKGLEADSVGLVAPKGSTIVQSLVSLKLLQKQAKQLGKQIAIVTSDEVGQNLASRIDLPVYADVRSRKPIEPKIQKEPESDGPIDLDMKEGSSEIPQNAKTAKKEEKAEKPVAEKTEENEDYGDLPKDFEVHRYDEKPVEEEVSAGAVIAEEEVAEEPEPEQPKKEVFAKKIISDQPKQTHEEREEMEAARPIKMEHQKFEGIKQKKSPKTAIIVTLVVVLFLGIVFLADLAVAKLQVNMSIPAEPITKTVLVSVEKDRTENDFSGGAIAGQQIAKDIDVSGSYKATGQKDAGDKAKGTLTFKNSYPTAQAISAGTTVRSSGGIDFVVDQDISVPGATLNNVGDKVLGSTTGPVTAKNTGLSGNLSASTTYVISSMSNISISGGTSGGTSKKITVVTQADLDAAKKGLTDKGLEQFKSEITKDSNQMYLPDANQTNFTDFTASKKVNDEATDFNATAKLNVVTIIFKADDFKAAVVALVNKTLPEGQSLLVTDSDVITPTLNQQNINVGKLQINGEIQGHVGPEVDLPKLEKSWKMKPIKKVKSDLEKIEGAKINEVKISPNFALPITPLLTKNISIKIDYTKN